MATSIYPNHPTHPGPNSTPANEHLQTPHIQRNTTNPHSNTRALPVFSSHLTTIATPFPNPQTTIATESACNTHPFVHNILPVTPSANDPTEKRNSDLSTHPNYNVYPTTKPDSTPRVQSARPAAESGSQRSSEVTTLMGLGL